jgi:tetratricopeptide (TPR) repeat protein
MWQWLLVLLSLIIPISSFSASTALGPTSSEEEALLWRESQKAVASSKHQDAVNLLERLVDRYPGSPHFIQAHLLLGKSHYELGEYQAALKPIQFYVSSVQAPIPLAEGKTLLGEAYLKLKKFHEAEILTVELDQKAKKHQLPAAISLYSKILKSEALLGLKNYERALETIDTADLQNESPLKNRSTYVKLKAKIWTCEKYPDAPRMNEGEAKNQLSKRGTCLLESLLLFQKVLSTGDSKFALLSATEVDQSFQRYQNVCSHPPLPSSGKRTAQQMKRYQSELADFLQQECRKQSSTALGLLTEWKTRVFPKMAEFIEPASRTLQHDSPRKL